MTSNTKKQRRLLDALIARKTHRTHQAETDEKPAKWAKMFWSPLFDAVFLGLLDPDFFEVVTSTPTKNGVTHKEVRLKREDDCE